MSATSPELVCPRPSVAARARRIATAGSLPLRVVIGSRLIVLLAGVVGSLLVSRNQSWQAFDPGLLSARMGSLGNVLAASAVRWDSIHYLTIAAHGYTQPSATVFFPLYPLLIHVLAYLTGSAALAGVLISLVSFAVALTFLHRLTRIELGPAAADAAVTLLAFAPLSFFFSAVYTESLFLALSVCAVYAARQDRPRVAALLGGLAAITRVTGVLLVIPLGLIWLRGKRRPSLQLGWVLVVPAGLLGYLGLLSAKGFGALSPFVQETGAQYDRHMSGPLTTIVQAIRAARAGLFSLRQGPIVQPSVGGPFSPGAESVLLLGVLVLAVLALAFAFRRLPLAYTAYALAALLISIWSPVPGQPLKSFDRYTLTIFPLWMAAGAWISQRRLKRMSVLASAGFLAFFTLQFATWAFIA